MCLKGGASGVILREKNNLSDKSLLHKFLNGPRNIKKQLTLIKSGEINLFCVATYLYLMNLGLNYLEKVANTSPKISSNELNKISKNYLIEEMPEYTSVELVIYSSPFSIIKKICFNEYDFIDNYTCADDFLSSDRPCIEYNYSINFDIDTFDHIINLNTNYVENNDIVNKTIFNINNELIEFDMYSPMHIGNIKGKSENQINEKINSIGDEYTKNALLYKFSNIDTKNSNFVIKLSRLGSPMIFRYSHTSYGVTESLTLSFLFSQCDGYFNFYVKVSDDCQKMWPSSIMNEIDFSR